MLLITRYPPGLKIRSGNKQTISPRKKYASSLFTKST